MNFEPSGFLVCRTPLLPFDDFLAWGNGLQAANALDNSTELEQAFAADRLQLRQRLRDVRMDELIDSQILIADLAPGVTGAEPTQSVVEHLEKIAAAAEPATVLRQVHMQLTRAR